MIERYVLFRDHGDMTLREIHHALRTRNLYLRLQSAGQLDEEAAISRFLSSVGHQA